MRDPRVDKWAEVLVHYSLQAKAGQHAVILAELEALPLVEACYEKLVQAGAVVDTIINPRFLAEIQFKYATDKQLSSTSPVSKFIAENCDLYLAIGADSNSKLLSWVDPKKQALASLARQPILNGLLNRAAQGKVRWAYTYFPTASAAQDAEMGTREYEEFIFDLGHLNEKDPIGYWKGIEEQQQKMIDYLTPKKLLHFQNQQGTDLKVDVSGMKWVNCCGKINFPDGEVYTGPNLESADGGVNGVARFSLPTLYKNTEVHGIELYFEKGEVVQAKASKGQEFLREMIAQDAGAKRVGEIAIGTNYQMNRVTKNILFDEKFGGTFHLALGKGYPETGNSNQSGLHWDTIFDLREGGTIKADGECFYQDGQFLR